MSEKANAIYYLIVAAFTGVMLLLVLSGKNEKKNRIVRFVTGAVSCMFGGAVLYGLSGISDEYIDNLLGFKPSYYEAVGESLREEVSELKDVFGSIMWRFFVLGVVFVLTVTVIMLLFGGKFNKKFNLIFIVVTAGLPFLYMVIALNSWLVTSLTVSLKDVMLEAAFASLLMTYLPIAVTRNKTDIDMSFVNDKTKHLK